MKLVGKTKILIAPLDWGLGHATRCIPIIYELISQGYEVIIAAEETVKILLLQEFPHIECLPLRGYRIRYSKTKAGLPFKILTQIPKIIYSISSENRWLNQVIRKNRIDIVISDNRYGFYNKNIYSVFITHQLFIKTPFLSNWIQKMNYHFINKFDECWIPDFISEPNLAGYLSHPKKLPVNKVRYIGWLSRFQTQEKTEEKHLLILLSGPEPQRTLLEETILGQLKSFPQAVLLVRGLPGQTSSITVGPNIQAVNHLPAKELQSAIVQASFVIARSGYSTIMDLLKLKKKTILIPTPGQTEQEYLAKHLLQSKLALYAEQQTFDLKKMIATAQHFDYCFYHADGTELLKTALSFDRGNIKQQ